MSKYIYDEDSICTNGDTMWYKADGVLANYEIAKNKNGYARTYHIQGISTSISRPLSWEEEDVSSSKEEAVALVKSEMKQALITSNFNGRFDGILMAMGEIPIPGKEVAIKPQLSLF
jgi:hypothetical protein